MESRSVSPFNWFVPSRSGENAFTALQKEMDRLVDSFGRGLAPAGMRPPSVDISETEKALVIAAELPGMAEQDVEVTLDNNILSIRGEKKQEHREDREDFHLLERSYGSFARSFQIPPGYDAEKVEARFDRGVLKITLPKAVEAQKQVRKIDVKSS